jgi:phosphopantothenoylcysteine synthetase/decarboxylase
MRELPSRQADAAIVAPATFNTINKLAIGIADNLALDILHQLIGRGTLVIILLFINTDL